MNNYFRETGIPSSVLHASASADVDLIENPGARKAVVIVDVSCDAGIGTGAAFRDVAAVDYVAPPGASANNGLLVLHVGAGASNFSAPIQLGENKGLSLDTTGAKITVTYFLKDL